MSVLLSESEQMRKDESLGFDEILMSLCGANHLI